MLVQSHWSARGECLGPSQAFPESMNIPMLTCDHLDAQECIAAFFSAWFFFLSSLVSLLFVSALIYCLGQLQYETIASDSFLTNILGEKFCFVLFLHWVSSEAKLR